MAHNDQQPHALPETLDESPMDLLVLAACDARRHSFAMQQPPSLLESEPEEAPAKRAKTEPAAAGQPRAARSYDPCFRCSLRSETSTGTNNLICWQGLSYERLTAFRNAVSGVGSRLTLAEIEAIKSKAAIEKYSGATCGIVAPCQWSHDPMLFVALAASYTAARLITERTVIPPSYFGALGASASSSSPSMRQTPQAKLGDVRQHTLSDGGIEVVISIELAYACKTKPLNRRRLPPFPLVKVYSRAAATEGVAAFAARWEPRVFRPQELSDATQGTKRAAFALAAVVDACVPHQPVEDATTMCDRCCRRFFFGECHAVWAPARHGWGGLTPDKTALMVGNVCDGETMVYASMPLIIAYAASVALDPHTAATSEGQEMPDAHAACTFSSVARLHLLEPKRRPWALPAVHRVLCKDCYERQGAVLSVLRASVIMAKPGLSESAYFEMWAKLLRKLDQDYMTTLSPKEALIMAADFAPLLEACVKLLVAYCPEGHGAFTKFEAGLHGQHHVDNPPSKPELIALHAGAVAEAQRVDRVAFSWLPTCRVFSAMRRFYRCFLEVFSTWIQATPGPVTPGPSHGKACVLLVTTLLTVCTPKKHLNAAVFAEADVGAAAARLTPIYNLSLSLRKVHASQ